jgi:hypothetical protein
MGFADSNYHSASIRSKPQALNSGYQSILVDLPFLSSGQRMLAVDPTTGEFVYADCTLDHARAVKGFTLSAGISEVPLVVSGIYEDPTMTWDPTLPLWLGEAGSLVQVRPTVGFLMQVGRVILPSKIVIDIQPAIILA